MILQPCIVSEDAGAVAAQIPSTMELTLEWTLAMGSRPGSALGKQERYPRPPLRPLVLHKRSRQTMEHKVSRVHLLVTLHTLIAAMLAPNQYEYWFVDEHDRQLMPPTFEEVAKCCFCGDVCGSAAGLLAHLTASHDRCLYKVPRL